MKAFLRTSVFLRASIMLTAVFLILALSAGSALAAPGDYYFPGSGSQIDADTMADLQEMVENGQLQLASPDEDDDYIVPPDESADDAQEPADEDEGVEPDNPGDEGLVPPDEDEPGEPEDLGNPNPGSEETPPADVPPTTTETPPTTGTPSSALPKTGTNLVIIAGMGLSLAALAFAVRKLVAR